MRKKRWTERQRLSYINNLALPTWQQDDVKNLSFHVFMYTDGIQVFTLADINNIGYTDYNSKITTKHVVFILLTFFGGNNNYCQIPYHIIMYRRTNDRTKKNTGKQNTLTQKPQINSNTYALPHLRYSLLLFCVHSSFYGCFRRTHSHIVGGKFLFIHSDPK